jgi:hypothetical protein
MTNPARDKPPARRSRARDLLGSISTTGTIADDQLAEALVVTAFDLERYRSGIDAMPLDRQLCLALVVIARAPALARQGYQLRGQVAAAIAFHDGATDTHSQSKPRGF